MRFAVSRRARAEAARSVTFYTQQEVVCRGSSELFAADFYSFYKVARIINELSIEIRFSLFSENVVSSYFQVQFQRI